MAHTHSHHDHHHDHTHSAIKNIGVAFFLNLFFTLIEIIGAIFTNSVAIMSDAIHDLGDSLSLGLAWYFQRLSHKSSNNKYSYGYKRFSLLGAIINSIVLVTGSILVLTIAIPRILHPSPTNTNGMLVLAVFGILVNGAAVFRLRKGNTLNEKVVSLHLIEDVLGWAAVLLGALIMHFFNLPIIDPILSIIIACYVLFNVYRNIGSSMRIILQGTPLEIDMDDIAQAIGKMKEINNIHDLHAWSIDGNYNILTVHIVLSQEQAMESMAILKNKIREILEEKGIQHATIEFETANEKCCFEKCC